MGRYEVRRRRKTAQVSSRAGMAVMIEDTEVEAPVASPSGDTQHCWECGSVAPGKGRVQRWGSESPAAPGGFFQNQCQPPEC